MNNDPWREKRSARPLGDYLDKSEQRSGHFQQILARAQQLARLEGLVLELLDPSLAPHVRLANVRDDLLILVTPVAPIATRLRLVEGELLQGLKEHGVKRFTRVQIRVAPLPVALMQARPQADS